MTDEEKVKIWAECARRDGDEEAAQAIEALLARSEQAERERDEARAKAAGAESERRRMEADWDDLAGRCTGAEQEAAEEKAARERAEWDNAALLDGLRSALESLGKAQGEIEWGTPARLACGRAYDAADAVVAADHPGAALLEQLRALERAHVQETSAKAYRHAAEVFGTWHEGECAAVLNRMADEADAMKEKACDECGMAGTHKVQCGRRA